MPALGQNHHVPPGGEEKRRAPRAEYLILVNFMIGGRIFSDYAQNVSMNGASIRCREASSFHVGQPVAVSFPTVKSQRQIQGEIARIGDGEFGVAFRGVGVKSKELSLYEGESAEADGALMKENRGLGRIRQKRIRWEPSRSQDVIGYRLYWSRDARVGYDSDHVDLGNVNQVTLPHGVPSFPLVEGEVQLGITAFNAAGNESAITEVSGHFNFVVPESPKGMVIEDVEGE